MKLIADKTQLINNLRTLENYLIEGNELEKEQAVSLVKRGTCFVAYKIGRELRFAPSRFIGYENNKLSYHALSLLKDGRLTNKALNEVLKNQPVLDKTLEKKYVAYCLSIGIQANETGTFGAPRKFWKLDLEEEINTKVEVDSEFPEGQLVERIHKARERNRHLIILAKEKFKSLHGSLYCQACKFDFEEIYGGVGKDFIECHHTIPVSEMAFNHKTKVEDIALLCSNCHKMVHKRRPWLSMSDLEKLIKKKPKTSPRIRK